MRRVPRWGLLCGVVGMALRAGLTTGRAAAPGAGGGEVGLQVGDFPPAFSATDVKGTAHTLEQYRGRIVVLHFWATWCPYCRTEIPNLTRLHDTEGARGVSVLTVSVDEHRDALDRFLTRNAVPYPVIADLESADPISLAYEVSGLPTTYVIGRDGRILSRWSGAGRLLSTVERLLSP